MTHKSIAIICLSLAVLISLFVGRQMTQQDNPQGNKAANKRGNVSQHADLSLPDLKPADYNWIGARIFQNEALGEIRYLTFWGEGEDFPSLGIGHFIWFPAGVDAPFDESFPSMVAFVQRHSPENLQLPDWLQKLSPFVAPWSSKLQFDEAQSSAEMIQLRDWLQHSQHLQARYIVSAFERRWHGLELPKQHKQVLNNLLQQLIATPEGLFAAVDYYNFKGLGNNPRERYQGQGWGLVQVLDEMLELHLTGKDSNDLVDQFSQAAAIRLRLRVELSPPQRNEARWLAGWLQRLDGYLVNASLSD